MRSKVRFVAAAAVLLATPAFATTDVHIDSAGIYSPGSVTVGFPTGAKAEYSTLINFTANKAGGPTFDLIGFCVDLYHNIFVNIGSQRATSLDYHRGQLTTDANGTALSSQQAMQIGGLATLGFSIAKSADPDKFAKLAGIQQAIWTIEYPTLTFDGSGGLAGQQGFADAFIAAAPGLKGSARAFYANDSATQGFVVAGVPEPAGWGLMIAGFGMIGFGARRRRMLAVAA